MHIPSQDMFEKIIQIANKRKVAACEVCRIIGISIPKYQLSCDKYHYPFEANSENKLKNNLETRMDLLKELFCEPSFADLEAQINNVIGNALAKEIIPDAGKVLFAWLDILGFKEMIEKMKPDEIKTKIEAMHTVCERVLEQAAEKIDYSYDFNFRIISDTIMIWSNGIHPRLLDFFFLGLCGIIRECFQIKIPVRGIVTFGNIFTIHQKINYFFLNESIYGKALVDAYTFEGKFDWAGCVIAPEVIQKMESFTEETKTFEHCKCQGNIIEHFFHCKPLLYWTNLPLKKGTVEGVALNWNYSRDGKKISRDDVKKAFGDEENIDPKVLEKRTKTLNFYDSTQDLEHFPINLQMPSEDFLKTTLPQLLPPSR